MIDVVRKSFRLIGREHRARWFSLMVLAGLASGLEILGALLVFVLLTLVADPGGEISVPLIGDIRQYAAGIDERTLLLSVAGAMGVFFVLRAMFQVFSTYAQQRVAHNAGARLANRLARGYLEMPYAFHLGRNTSELIRNANAAATHIVNQAYLPMIRVAADGVLTLSLLVVMFVVSPTATAIAAVVVGGSSVILLLIVQPRLKALGRTVQDMNRETLKALQQPLHGVRDIKLLGTELFFARTYERCRRRLARASYQRGTMAELPRHVIETALIGFILIFFAYAVATGRVTQQVLSTLGLFAYAGLRLQPSLNRAVRGLNELKHSTAAVDDVYADVELIERMAPRVEDRPRRPFERELVLEDVSFTYEGAYEPALIDVDLTLHRGETLGICGTTGSGKTTLVDIMTGLLEPSSGRLLIDGRELNENVRGWQKNLGVVPQMVFLIDDTLRRNIALGIPDDEIDDEAVAKAVDLAQLSDFVARAHDGLDTVVGERGVRISGGQRQRIAIARALYHDASVLVFDEGTSALDNATEAALMKALERLRGDYTIVLVAHRLSTVRNCDRIAYVENGRIAGLDNYDRLIAQNEGFRALAASN